MSNRYKTTVEKLLAAADIQIDGNRPWDIQVHDERLYKRFLADGSLGAGESYMEGWWDAEDLEAMVHNAFKADMYSADVSKMSLIKTGLLAKATNKQTIKRSYQNAQHHYDIGNDLYRPMLGKTLNYTCGYWEKAKNLDEAQEAKMDLICRKLKLKPGMTVLDIGCGWGSFMAYAAKKYGVSCVGLTLSKEQAKLAKERTGGLPIKIILQDYREFTHKPFDRVVSIGMFEHVGIPNYREFMNVNARLVKDDGLVMLHTIGRNRAKDKQDPWIDRYIFPGGELPAIENISAAMTDVLVIEDLHNFGPDYAKTLRAWWKNFDAAYPKLDHTRYDEKFYRMWKFYLQTCAANFTARGLQLWQIVATKPTAEQIYRSIR